MHHKICSWLKILGISTIICCGYVNVSFGDDPVSVPGSGNGEPTAGQQTGDTGGDTGGGNVAPISFNSVTKTLCPAGQYVYKCGSYRIGFEWLKGMNVPNEYTEDNCSTNRGSWDDDTCKISTKNYYISDDQSELLQQMRDFFGGKEESVFFCEGTNCSAVATDYKTDRDTILNNVCNPFDSGTAITCAYCPDSAKTDATIVTVNVSSKTVKNWVKFNTIADCYIDSFSDSTGTYKYVTDGDISRKAQNCYYANDNTNAFNTLSGDSITNFAPGTNASITTGTVYIPSSGTSGSVSMTHL